MDSAQKRDRDRKKRQRRQDKAARRKERTERKLSGDPLPQPAEAYVDEDGNAVSGPGGPPVRDESPGPPLPAPTDL